MAILSNLLAGSFSSSPKSHTAVRRAVCGILSMKRLQNSGGSVRCYSSSSSPKSSPLDSLFSEMRSLHKDVNPSVVALRSVFSASGGGHCSRAGAGVFVDRGLIVTSAHVVGKLSRSDVHICSIGSTFAVTIANQILKMKAVAVDFTGDVAVLETEGEGEGDLLPPPCVVASSIANKEFPLMVITKDEGCNGGGVLQMKVKFVEDISTNRIDWPYEVEDGFGWARYGGKLIDEVKVVPGSPWFSSIGRQVVGTASWAVGEEVVGSVGGFVAPPLRIKSVVDYAKRKGPSDPVVLDRWINAVTFADYDDADHVKECLKKVQSGYVITTYLDYEWLK